MNNMKLTHWKNPSWKVLTFDFDLGYHLLIRLGRHCIKLTWNND